MNDENEKKPLENAGSGAEAGGGTGIGLGLCFGSAIGLLVYVATGNMTWFPIGMAIGCSLGLTFGTTNKKGK